MTDIPDRLLKVREVAELLGRTTDSVRHSLQDGTLPGAKVGGRWYVPGSHLRAIFERQERERVERQAQRAKARTDALARLEQTRAEAEQQGDQPRPANGCGAGE